MARSRPGGARAGRGGAGGAGERQAARLDTRAQGGGQGSHTSTGGGERERAKIHFRANDKKKSGGAPPAGETGGLLRFFSISLFLPLARGGLHLPRTPGLPFRTLHVPNP